MADLNNAPLKDVGRSTMMRRLAMPFEMKQSCLATVMKNGHVLLRPDKHYYGDPYRFIGNKMKLLYSRRSEEIYAGYGRIAMHNRTKSPHCYMTDKEYMRSINRFVSEWTLERFLAGASEIHEGLSIQKILDRKQHSEQGFKVCMGILSFAKKVADERLIKGVGVDFLPCDELILAFEPLIPELK